MQSKGTAVALMTIVLAGWASTPTKAQNQGHNFVHAHRRDSLGGNHHLQEVQVVASGVRRIARSPYNALAVDARSLHGTTMSLADALSTLPGMRLREAGGLGSSMQLMMDGFSGKHVKVFIDGIPQEGVGNAFSLNNIPINFADRIEVYKGVVPVEFGTDAIGGVVNIVTGKSRARWWVDGSYSYGSFNTHKSYLNVGQSFKNGLFYQLNIFQNYSDNSYHVDAPVQIFKEDGTSLWDLSKTYHVRRFHDTYHNEAAVAKVGVAGKRWADRLAVGLTYARSHKDIQTGITQDIVYGGKFNHGYSWMPSVEWAKRGIVKGLDVSASVNWNRNTTFNVDTASYRYNWFGERQAMRSAGEQSYQNNKLTNNNWNAQLTLNYRLAENQVLTLNHVSNMFKRSILSDPRVSDGMKAKNAIARRTAKHITGLGWKWYATERFNANVFAKFYQQHNAGPFLAKGAADNAYQELTNDTRSLGYGLAATYFILPSLQAKLSYERAYRLPTNEELFGDEDLELGDVGLKPESSHNVNFNLAWNRRWHAHRLYVEGSLIYRNTHDFIQRSIAGSYSGGLHFASYVNHGRVLTKGWSLATRYSFKDMLTVGGAITDIDTRDNNQYVANGSTQRSVTYKVRMPNIPYFFFNTEASLRFRNVLHEGNTLTLGYDNAWVHSYSLYPENLGDARSRMLVPTQMAHNAQLSYALQHDRWVLSLECRNFTNAKLYDNFSLQKPGRAIYAKVKVHFGG